MNNNREIKETEKIANSPRDNAPLVVDVDANADSNADSTATAGAGLIRIPCRHNPVLAEVMNRVNADAELFALWKCANTNAVDRLCMSDHGRVHVQIVANIALKMLRLLLQHDVSPSIVTNHGLTTQDAEVVVVLGALVHDLGIAVHRDEHEHHSLWVASPKVKELLDGLYDIETRTIVWAEVMHSIVAHAREATPLTVEAGVLKVADALDMAKGRSRIPFEAGKVNIHSLSAAAIERIIISDGESKPIRIEAIMSNSAGIFQLDELLKGKLMKSGLEQYFDVLAHIDGQAETKLLAEYRID